MLFLKSSIVPFLKFMFYSFLVQPECYINSFVIILFLSCTNRSGSNSSLFLQLLLLVSFNIPLSYSSVLDLVHPHCFVLISPHPFFLPSRS